MPKIGEKRRRPAHTARSGIVGQLTLEGDRAAFVEVSNEASPRRIYLHLQYQRDWKSITALSQTETRELIHLLQAAIAKEAETQ